MRKTEYFALSRSRDHQGNVVNRQLKPIVNCIHTQVGGARRYDGGVNSRSEQ